MNAEKDTDAFAKVLEAHILKHAQRKGRFW